MTSISLAPIIAGSSDVLTIQLDALPDIGMQVIGVEPSGQLVLVDTEDLPGGPPGADGDDGRGIASIVRTSGTGAAGTTDTYTITFTDSTTTTFSVVNGANGANGAAGAQGIPGPNVVSTTTPTAIAGLIGGNGTNVVNIIVGAGIEFGANEISVSKASIGLGSVDNVSAASLRDRSTHTGNLNVDKARVSSANFETLLVDATTNATTFRIGATAGSAGGSVRAVQYGALSAVGVWFTAFEIDATGRVGDVNYGGGAQLAWNGSGVLRWLANGVLRLTNSAVTIGACLSFITDNLIIVRNRTNTADAALQCSGLRITSLPTSNPAIAGQLWNDGGTVKVSAG
jgi:hypothetical protein